MLLVGLWLWLVVSQTQFSPSDCRVNTEQTKTALHCRSDSQTAEKQRSSDHRTREPQERLEVYI